MRKLSKLKSSLWVTTVRCQGNVFLLLTLFWLESEKSPVLVLHSLITQGPKTEVCQVDLKNFPKLKTKNNQVSNEMNEIPKLYDFSQ